jgi:hypothetical protein
MEGESLANQPSHADKIRAGLAKWRGVPPGMPDVADQFMAKLRVGKTIKMLTSAPCTNPDYLCSYVRFKKQWELNPEWGREAWRVASVPVKGL